MMQQRLLERLTRDFPCLPQIARAKAQFGDIRVVRELEAGAN